MALPQVLCIVVCPRIALLRNGGWNPLAWKPSSTAAALNCKLHLLNARRSWCRPEFPGCAATLRPKPCRFKPNCANNFKNGWVKGLSPQGLKSALRAADISLSRGGIFRKAMTNHEDPPHHTSRNPDAFAAAI